MTAFKASRALGSIPSYALSFLLFRSIGLTRPIRVSNLLKKFSNVGRRMPASGNSTLKHNAPARLLSRSRETVAIRRNVSTSTTAGAQASGKEVYFPAKGLNMVFSRLRRFWPALTNPTPVRAASSAGDWKAALVFLTPWLLGMVLLTALPM
ncbi:MAG TPA: hypothetical protein VL147_03670, partial [Devosia sp.]|nr:hypothetical protein [Devosia sp.]